MRALNFDHSVTTNCYEIRIESFSISKGPLVYELLRLFTLTTEPSTNYAGGCFL
jgi:hypothetical protein